MEKLFDWIRIYQAENALEAYLIKGLLHINSIDVRFHGEALAGALGEIPQDQTYISILVLQIKQRQAEKILLEYQTQRQSTHEWFCRHCGEKNGAGFELCWSCLMDKDEQTE
ncbi:putative signal transducing protein [Pseudoalteromonas tunicata]|jgi:hypothetical protein|uniref:Putative orphan protein n=1 Tax=Pseudoalteromonas tunicata D2 TaxID=87626 RepID=A4C7B5_9GAMM|nr:DUF2007 domain-containing protein [Pseudoalteromonas tunicata]ATC95839.1 hypothetical protein PTUN_a3529 [Pseudoalteromonas tunicata]AXT31384.1 DUF2007 domain-containing protein [Pseudoalteromonas tunicata]EAR29869.1 putative orphan protein [Pseudoalteromonas tunicata D2]MDP4982198.1 DUF2007 domain-containing protein [Pseudoalteromonas tunicata]MDP5214357.1 DUF2007 domain-containing protein [Pseudoalteromonas tunicata]